MKLFRNVRFWIGILFIVLIIGVRFSGVSDYATITNLQEKRIALTAVVNAHYEWAVLAFILWYIVIVTLALPLAALSTIAGGYVFGVVPAIIFAGIGATIGSTLFFLLVRYVFGDSLQEKYKGKLAKMNYEMEQFGVFYLIAIRLVALIPLAVVNLLIGLTQVPVWTFIWTTVISILPGTFVFAFAGKQLTTITSIQDVFSIQILLAFALLALLAMLPLVAKKMGWFGMK